MRMRLTLGFILVLSSILGTNASTECPPGCFCDRRKGDSFRSNQERQRLRVRCVQLESGNFDPRLLPNNTVQLDLSGYGLRGIGSNFFKNLEHLEKVDLSGNAIEYLDENAFRNLGDLKLLDISGNQLTVLTMDTLQGLSSLERLKLNDNAIQTIEFGAFSHMPNIQKIDLSDNPLICDCNIGWMLGHWLEVAGAKARCSSPTKLKDVLLKKLSVGELTCDVPMLPTLHHQSPNSVIVMEIVPRKPQIVFEGDSLRLQCHVGLLTNDILIRWFHNEKLIEHSGETSITNLGPNKNHPTLGQQSQLYITKLNEADSGNWTCSALVDTGLVQNMSVSVVVISSAVVLCPATTTNTSKGVYSWGVTVAGHAASQPCHNVSLEHDNSAMVEYMCHQSGHWSVLNDSACGHTSDVTDKLYRFASMNNSDFDHNTLIQSARKLLEFTSAAEKFQDGMDLVFLSTVLENYLPYLTTSQELASLLVDIAANTMRMTPDIVYQGQLLGHAASRLIATIANISRIVPAFQLHRKSMAVESFKVSPRSFAGITCSWYTELDTEAGSRKLHCSENNVTLSNPGRLMLGSVKLPSTLYHQLELLGRDTNIVKNIMFSAFTNASLFPQISSQSEPGKFYKVVSSCVMGSSLLTAEPFNLSEPVYIILRLSSLYSRISTVPAWWDNRANNGLGAWIPGHCKLMNDKHQLNKVFYCNRLGYYALLAGHDTELIVKETNRQGDMVSTFSMYSSVHSAVYTSTIISIVLLCLTVCLFTYLYPRIRITRKLKHALPNFWMSIIFFLIFYALSISVQSARPLCLSVGILLHYFVLTTCLWLTIISSIVYRKLVNPTDTITQHTANPYVTSAQEEIYIGDGKKYKKPLGQYYLIGWGVPLIICGITAGASFSQYTDSGFHWCFLSLAPAIGAVLIPVVLISTIHLFFILAIFSFSNKSSLETKLVTSIDMSSSHSTLLVTDSHNSHKSHTRVLLMVSLLILNIFIAATLSVTSPLAETILSVSSQHTIFSVIYSLLICLLSVLILTYYCLARQDIVHCKLPLSCGHTVQDETSNLVDLTAKSMIPNNTNNYLLDNSMKTAYPMVELGGSVLGPSTGGRLKQCNLERDSEDDYHSVNNSQHLSRPRPGGISESEINRSMSDIIFGPSSKIKVNNINIHMAEQTKPWMGAPTSDWSMQDVIPRTDWSVQSQQPYYPPAPAPAPQVTSPFELPYPDISNLVLSHTKLQQDQQQQHASGGASASLPRRHPRRQERRRNQAGGGSVIAYSDVEKTDIYSSSRVSEISSSTAASIRSRSSRNK